MQVLAFEESIKRRPGMYFGNEGVIGILNGLMIDCVKSCQSDKVTFEITVADDNNFVLGIITQHDLKFFWQKFSLDTEEFDFNDYLPKGLKIVSASFEIKFVDNSKSEICFSFDKNIIVNTAVDYLKLLEKTLQFALLNRNSEVVTTDKRQKYLMQNYCHFPQGVFYLFDRALAESLGKPEFKLMIDLAIGNNTYQIGLAYRTDWFPKPNVISFANDVNTVCGGSLVEGVLDGLISACRSYVKDNGSTNFKISRKKFANGLILVCAVRGPDFKYGGNWKQTLEDVLVKEEAKRLVSKSALDFFRNQKEKAAKFLSRFDTTQWSSGLY
jgi:DNA gyrase/topoisomerase IV subunit B